ncbi:MAG: hypothetical protein Q9165_003018 [Trypethelium subeluteriae]
MAGVNRDDSWSNLRYTSFPGLYPCQHNQRAHNASRTVLESLVAPDEILLVAWALLLAKYTQVDNPIFSSDDNGLQVETSNGVLKRLSHDAITGEHFTGVYFTSTRSKTHGDGDLEFSYSSTTQVGELRSNGFVPPDHLEQLALQLKAALLEAFDLKNRRCGDDDHPRPALSILNPTPRRADGPQLLHQLVRWHPAHQDIAIDFLGEEGERKDLKWDQLDKASSKLARDIHARLVFGHPEPSVTPIVPILIPQSLELYVTQLAVLKAGCAFCPLNLDAPEERIRFILQDVSATLIVTVKSLREKLKNLPDVSILEAELEYETSIECQQVDIDPAGIAYVMYTSGSTGKPKGVAISHRAATQALLAHDQHIPSFNRFLQFASPTFDVSVFEIFFPLFRGSTLVSCERSIMLNDLSAVINSLEIDAAELTPTVAGSLLQRRENVSRLQLLLTIGEMLTRNVIEEFGESSDRRGILYGMYGPTEAAIHCTLQSSFRTEHKVGTIGIPLQTVSAFILAPASAEENDNSNIKILPVGQIGELAVGGHQLADGYLNRPDQTSAVFVNTTNYGRLYRTGDKARLLPDGSLECLGRMTTGQVKLRGQRVELAEIEEVLLRSSSCHAAVASIVDGVLVVFCLMEEGGLGTESLYQLCRKWLPAFMIPADIVVLHELPRLPSGKADRKLLGEQYQARDIGEIDEIAPENEREMKILSLARKLLVNELSVTDSLGQKGLDSLAAIRLASCLRSGGFSATVANVLKHRSVRDLAQHIVVDKPTQSETRQIVNSRGLIDRLTKSALENESIQQHRSELTQVLPCSPLQNALLVETSRRNAAYWNWIELELQGRYSEEQIRDIFLGLSAENGILRSGFYEIGHRLHPFVLLVWQRVLDSQVLGVDEFQYDPPSGSDALLRPLNVQVRSTNASTSVLIHIHHALYDGWSMDLIIRDFDCLLQGAALPARPQYLEVIGYHLSEQSAERDTDRIYWQEKLSNSEPCKMPNLCGRSQPEQRLERLDRLCSSRLDNVRTRARKHEFSPQIYFQAAFAYLLALYTGSSDVILGTVSSGRTLPITGIEEIIGPCIATLPLRIDVSQSRSGLDLLRAIHRLNREIMEHCTIPLREIKNSCGLQPGRSLFDTLLIWQESPLSSSPPEAIRVVNSADYLEFNLLLELEPFGNSVRTRATFQPSLIPLPQMEILLAQLDSLVAWLLDCEDELLEKANECFDLDQLSMENQTPLQVPFDGGVAALVQKQVSITPEAPALAFASQAQTGLSIEILTFRELNEKAIRLSQYLMARGIKQNALVGICLEKSIELYTCILAAIYAGAGYLPLTPDTPTARIKAIMQEAGVTLCLSQGAVSKQLKLFLQSEIIDVDGLHDELSRQPNNVPLVSCKESDVAYTVFTSGSTGTPKGVLVTHQNLSSNIKTLEDMYPVTRGSKLLQACSQAFDVSAFEIFFTWSTGMCLCSTSKDVLFQDIEGIIREFGITHLSLTPTVAALIKPDNVPSVEFLVTSGEAVTEQVFKTWAERGLWQGYGPSETTNICTVNARVSEMDLINNIGPPFPNTSAFVLSKGSGFDLIPRGGVGELCFGGDQVFRGYLKMPELNSQKIINHPDFGRIYRSGDLGRLLYDGSVLFEGRLDDQIKLRGQRIELGEVNAAVLRVNSVRDCFSTVIQQSAGLSQRLVTFWVVDAQWDTDFSMISIREELRKKIDPIYEALRAALPAYMVPVNLIPITHLPMTTQGKIDKPRLIGIFNELDHKTLDKFSESSADAHDDQVWTSEERSLAAIVAEALSVPITEIGRHTSFFSLGLDSISAISVASSIRRKMDLSLDLSTILKCPTVARVSQAMDQGTRKKPITKASTSKGGPSVFPEEILEVVRSTYERNGESIQTILPCTPLQEAMLSMGPGTAAYRNRTLFRIHGDIERLKGSWQEMCRRHDILRTTFLPIDSVEYAYAQVVLAEAKLPWVTSATTVTDFDALMSVKIDVAHGNEYRTHLPYSLTNFKIDGIPYLLLSMHHALYDAVAVNRLLYEIEVSYRAQSDLPPVVSFAIFLDAVVSTDLSEADQFWTSHLAHFAPIAFPHLSRDAAMADTPGPDYHLSSQTLNIGLDELERACKSASSTMLCVTQAAFAKILSLYLGRSDICFGNVVSGRGLPVDDIERIVAPCFNTLPVRVELSSLSTNIELIQDLQRYNLDVLPFHLTPLRRIQARTAHAGQSLFDTLFILQQPARDLDHNIWSLEKDYGEMNFPFVIELIPNIYMNALSINVYFESGTIPLNDVQYVFEAYENALRSCMTFPSASVSDLVNTDPLQSPANATEFAILSSDKIAAPVFGIGDLYFAIHRSQGSPGSYTTIKKNGRSFYKTGKLARVLPHNRYATIDNGRTVVRDRTFPHGATTQEDTKADWTGVECSIREVITQFARASESQIKRNTTIYQLGLDSINAVQIAAKLRERGLKVSASDMMEHPTCASLAVALQQKRSAQPAYPKFNFEDFATHFKHSVCATHYLDEAEVHSIRPCTPLQSGLLAESIHSQTRTYVNEIKMQLYEYIDIQRFHHAWRAVQQKYAILRTGFAQINHSKFPMAMIEYNPSAVKIPWQRFSDTVRIQEVVEQSATDILSALHRIPWRLILFPNENSHTSILLVHHAIYDAQLLQSILDDVAKAYSGYELSPAPSLDAAIAEILEDSNDESEHNRQFWEYTGKRMAVSRFPNLTPLVVDHGEPYVEARECHYSLAELEEGSRVAGTTMQAVAQAALAQLLSCYIGETDVTFGVVLSGRTTDVKEHAALPCIITVPVPCHVRDDGQQLLGEMLDYNAKVQRHQFTPLPKIQRWTGHPDQSLFDTILTYQKRNASPIEITKPWVIEDEKATVNYTVSLELEPCLQDGSLIIRLAAKDNVLPRPQARLMLEQIEEYIVELLFAPGAKLRQAETHREHILSITPAKDQALSSSVQLLHQFVEHTASESPRRIALEFATSLSAAGRQRWNYREINESGNRVAHLLQGHGVKPGSIVATCFDKGPEASFAFIGILKAGCAFVALDPTAPLARKSFIIEDSQSKVVLSTKSIAASLPQSDGVYTIDLDSCRLENWPSHSVRLAREVEPDDLSYCLYTSGTTGTPKGCMITHKNVVQAMLSFQKLFAGHWNQDSRWLQFASFHFDVSVLEQFWSWSVGICVVSAPRNLVFQDIAEAIRQLRITHIDLTPSLAKLLHPDDVPSLCEGVFITGGESLKQEIIEVWGPRAVIYNGYGPTEATIGVTMLPRVPYSGKPSNIGRQFDNVGTYVLKPNSNTAVLRGGIGELCIAGTLVGRGYLNRPELTNERFPFLQRYGERVYRTGDLVRILHDGTFIFHGRIDDQVKLRGQRLEIGEINNVLVQALPEIADVSTLVLKHPKQQKDQLVTFTVPKKSAREQEPRVLTENQAQLLQSAHKACEARLPSYMIPSYFIPISRIPLTINNKVDARRLQIMFDEMSLHELQRLAQHMQQPSNSLNPTETRIVAVLADFLSVSTNEISPLTSIFELGLESILAIGFTRALKNAGFHNAEVSTVMGNSRIQSLAKALTTTTSDHSDGAIVAARQNMAAYRHKHIGAAMKSLDVTLEMIESLAPCTPLQEGIISRSLNDQRPVYFNSFLMELAEDVNSDTLKTAWERVFEAVQILRTRFISTTDGYVQVIVQQLQLPWTEQKLDDESHMNQFLGESADKWMDINRNDFAKPFEIVIARCPTKTVMALHLFHALYDGNSMQLLLNTLVKSFADNKTPAVGPSFHDALPFGPLRRADGAEHFWIEHLASVKPGQLPHLSGLSSREDCFMTIDIHGLHDFDSVRQRLGVTDQALFQACWASLLLSYFGSDVVFGNVISGRSVDFEGADKVIGPLFNTIPFAPKIQQGDSWSSVVKACHEFNVSVLPYQHTPLRDISKWCKFSQHQPLFEVLFVFQKETPRIDTSECLFRGELGSENHADYPLALEVERKYSGIFTLTLAAQGNIADRGRCTEMLHTLKTVLEELLANPDGRISTFVDDSSNVDNGEQKNRTFDTPNSQLSGIGYFDWTPNANIIRSEIAALAGLDENDIDEHCSIFELGLDSIDAIKLSSVLKKSGIALSTSSIMQSLTVSRMLQYTSLAEVHDQDLNSGLLATREVELARSLFGDFGVPETVNRILPVTPLQEGMLSEMIKSNFQRYFNHDVLKMAKYTDLDLLQSAWEKTFASFPILRTIFTPIDNPGVDDAFTQIIYNHSNFPWHEVYYDAVDDFSTIMDDVTREVRRTFAEKPPVRLTTVHCPNESYLMLSLPHAMYDGWSLQLLHEAVHEFYYEHDLVEGEKQNASNANRDSKITGQSFDHVLQQIVSSLTEEQEAFWRNQLSGYTPSALPSRVGSSDQRSPGVLRREIRSQIALESVASLCRTQGITLQAFGATCWAFVLASLYRQLDVVFGIVLSGRDTIDAESIVFPTMNTVCVRSIIHKSKQDMLKYTQETISEIMPHQHVPLRKILAQLPSRDRRLFDTLFIYQKRRRASAHSETSLYESVGGASDVEYPMCIEMETIDDAIIWRTAWHEDVLDHIGTADVLQKLDTVAMNIIRDPRTPAIKFHKEGNSICGLPPFEPTVDNDSQRISTLAMPESPDAVWSDTEQKVRRVLSTVSKVPEKEITKDMTIFHLGLDSISAIKISTLFRRQDIKLPVSDIIGAASITRIARIADCQEVGEAGTADSNSSMKEVLKEVDLQRLVESVKLDAENIEEVLQTSAGQDYMLSTWQNARGASLFPTFDWQVDNCYDIEHIQKAWSDLVAEMPILRTCFVATSHDQFPLVQVIMRNAEPRIFRAHADALTGSENPSIITMQPFLHIVADVEERRIILHLRIHHALYDAVSLQVLRQRFENFINGVKTESNSSQDHSGFLSLSDSPEAKSKCHNFWTQYLADASPPSLLQPLTSQPRRVELFKPSLITTKSLENISRRHGIPLQAIFLALWSRLYASLSPRANSLSTTADYDVVFGVYLANRAHLPDLYTANFPTVNLVPLRVRSFASPSILDVARKIQDDLREVGRPENSAVRLWEIDRWTEGKVKVDCFVNFLSLLEGEDSEDERAEEENGQGAVRVREASRENSKERKESFEPRGQDFVEPEELKGNSIRESYPHPVDVEVALRKGGLDVGIFAPEDMVEGIEGAERLVSTLKDLLLKVGGDA